MNRDRWHHVKRERYHEHFPGVARWLAAHEHGGRRGWRGGHGRDGRRRMRFVPALALTALVVACLVPVERTERLGYTLNCVMDMTATEAMAQLPDWEWLHSGNRSISESVQGEDTRTLMQVFFAGDDQVAAERLVAVSSVPVVTSAHVAPVDVRVRRPLVSQVVRQFFNITISPDATSDSEWNEAVRQQLREQGMEALVRSTNIDGVRTTTITVPPAAGSIDPRTLDIQLEVPTDSL